MEYLRAKKAYIKTKQYVFTDPYVLPTHPGTIMELYNILLTVLNL